MRSVGGSYGSSARNRILQHWLRAPLLESKVEIVGVEQVLFAVEPGNAFFHRFNRVLVFSTPLLGAVRPA